MKTRALGRTGLNVSEVGLGAWQLGQASKLSAEQAVALVGRALDLGVSFFDTAPNYGDSELLLGRALAGRRDSVVVCTKFGHAAQGEKNFALELLAPSLENSLRRLRTDRVDVVLLHNPPRELLSGSHPVYEELARLRQQGKLRFFGASVDFAVEVQELLDTRAGDVLEVLFNVFHQDPRRMFERAEQAGVGLVVKVPLDSGWLSGRYAASSKFTDIRSRWTPEVLQKRFEFLERVRFIAQGGASLAQAALRFVLAHSAVSTVIPGATSLAQLEENVSASQAELAAEHVSRLHELWQNELQNDMLPW